MDVRRPSTKQRRTALHPKKQRLIQSAADSHKLRCSAIFDDKEEGLFEARVPKRSLSKIAFVEAVLAK